MKVCPFCNAEIPEEAVYCLKCTSMVNDRQVFPIIKEKNKKKIVFTFPRKKIISIVAIILSIAVVMSSCFFAIRFSRDNTPVTNNTLNSSTIDYITNNNSTQIISDTTTNTESTTKKQTLLDKLFGKDETEIKDSEISETKSETTTKKQSFFDKLFGNDEDEKENSSSTSKKESTTKEKHSINKPIVDDENTTNNSSSVIEPETTTKPESTPNKAESSATSTTTTTESTTAELTYSKDEDFEYEFYSGSTTKISLTKYTGNANYVTVPVYIDGLMVVEIQSDTFKDNNNIKTIDIPDEGRSYLWLRNNCFNNLSSFETLNLYSNDIGMYGKFALYCPIKNINVTFWQYKFVDGALYQWNSKEWELIYFAGNPCYSVLNLADWCTGIEGSHNLKYADNLKVINVSKETVYVPTSYSDYNKNLEAINVQEGNAKFYSKDGVLFYKGKASDSNYKGAIYPYGKKDKVFVMPLGTVDFTLTYNLGSGNTNTYLEELHIPANCKLDRADYLSTYSSPFPNLKKICIADGHSQYTTIRKTFTGEMETF